MKPLLSLAVAFLLAASSVWAADSNTIISDLRIIDLHNGVNDIPHLVPSGRDGQIIKLWRDNGNADGYTLFLVTINGKVIGVGTPDTFDDVIRDQPHTSADAVKSVRFAWGRIEDEDAMLLITATRELAPKAATATPAPVLFNVYQLVANGDSGTTGDFFTPVSEFRSRRKYCNSDLAMFQILRMPLPNPFNGPNMIDGCL